jgi:hypothetical protein
VVERDGVQRQGVEMVGFERNHSSYSFTGP